MEKVKNRKKQQNKDLKKQEGLINRNSIKRIKKYISSEVLKQTKLLYKS